MATSAETQLNALRRLPSNKACANCDAESKFGHQNIVERTKAFVCSMCKSAHQSFSFRVKSVTMSNWELNEVFALKDENGGGNAACRRRWLAKWDESQLHKPTSNDPLEYYKHFVNVVYNQKAFYAEEQEEQEEREPAVAQAPTPSINLLDFNDDGASNVSNATSFDAFSVSSSSNASMWSSQAVTASSSNRDDMWGEFTASGSTHRTASVASSSSTANHSSFDPFGLSSAAATSVVSSPGSQSSVSTSRSHMSSSMSFDPFASAPQVSPTQSVSSNSSQSGSFRPDFSAFDAVHQTPPAPSPSQPSHMNNHLNGNGMQSNMSHQPVHSYASYQQQMQQASAGQTISSLLDPSGMNGSSNTMYQSKATSKPSRPMNGRDPFAGLGLP